MSESSSPSFTHAQADPFGPRSSMGDLTECSPLIQMSVQIGASTQTSAGAQEMFIHRETLISMCTFLQGVGEFLLRSGVSGHRQGDGLESASGVVMNALQTHSIQARWPQHCAQAIPKYTLPPNEVIPGLAQAQAQVVERIYETIAAEIAPTKIPSELLKPEQKKRLSTIMSQTFSSLWTATMRASRERHVPVATGLDLWTALRSHVELLSLFGFLGCRIESLPELKRQSPLLVERKAEGIFDDAMTGDTIIYTLPTYAEAMQLDMINGIAPIRELNQSSWYHDASRLLRYATEVGQGTRFPSTVDCALEEYRIRPLQFLGLRHLQPSSIFAETSSGSRDAIVSFIIQDDRGQDFAFLLNWNASSEKGRVVCLWSGEEVGQLRASVKTPHQFLNPPQETSIEITIGVLPTRGFKIDAQGRRKQFELTLLPQEERMIAAQEAFFQAGMEDMNLERERDGAARFALLPPSEDASTELPSPLYTPSRDVKAPPPVGGLFSSGMNSLFGDEPGVDQSLSTAPGNTTRQLTRARIQSKAWNASGEERGNVNAQKRTLKKMKEKFIARSIEQRVGAALAFTEFSRFGPSLYTENHDKAIVREFNTHLLDAAMSATGLIPLPKVLLQLIGEYHTFHLPFLPDEAKAQMSSFPLVIGSKSCYAGHNANPVERVKRSTHPDAVAYSTLRRTVRDYRSSVESSRAIRLTAQILDDYQSDVEEDSRAKETFDPFASNVSSSSGKSSSATTTNKVETINLQIGSGRPIRPGEIATCNYRLTSGLLPEARFPRSVESRLKQLRLPTTIMMGVLYLTSDINVCERGDVLAPEQCEILEMCGVREMAPPGTTSAANIDYIELRTAGGDAASNPQPASFFSSPAVAPAFQAAASNTWPFGQPQTQPASNAWPFGEPPSQPATTKGDKRSYKLAKK